MQGGSNSQTTTQQAPSWQLPYQQYGLNQAQSQYQNMPQLVAPFAPQQEQAISNISALANGSGGYGSSPYSMIPEGSGPVQSGAPQQNWGWGGEQLQPKTPQTPQMSGSLSANLNNAGAFGGGAPPSQQSGGPWINSAQNYVQNTLGGNVMQNPELNNLFQLGANQIQQQMASEFAGAGRNVDQSQGQTGQALGNFAANLYGNAFNTETGAQLGALNAAPGILSSQLGLQNSLFGAGQDVQNLSQQYIQAPQNALNQYMNRVNGNLGGTQTFNPAFNAGAGALGGALLGSNLGNGIGNSLGGSSGGGWGSLIGGLLGGAFGG